MQQSGQELSFSPYGSPYKSIGDEESLDYYSHCEDKTEASSQILSDDTPKRPYGKSVVFFWRNNQPIFSIGPDWLFFFIGWFAFEGTGILLYFTVLSESSPVVKAVSGGLIIWQGFIYLLTAIKNPGMIAADSQDSLNLLKLGNSHRVCSKCKIIKDDTTVHCSFCDICIKGYDHHCPWTGKCIGSGNLYPFYAFLFSSFFYMGYFILLVVRML